MFLVCVTDQVRRLGGAHRKGSKAENGTQRKARAI